MKTRFGKARNFRFDGTHVRLAARARYLHTEMAPFHPRSRDLDRAVVRGIGLGLIAAVLASAAIVVLLRVDPALNRTQLISTAVVLLIVGLPAGTASGLKAYGYWPDLYALWRVPYTHRTPPPFRYIALTVGIAIMVGVIGLLIASALEI